MVVAQAKGLQKAQDSLGYMTITTNRIMSAMMRRRFKEADIALTAEQWGVLLCLWGSGPMSQEALGAMLATDKSRISRLLAVMEEAGFIIRTIDSQDIRCKSVSPTPWSKKLKPRCMAIANEILGLGLEGVSQEKAAICLEVLQTIKENLQSLPGEAET